MELIAPVVRDLEVTAAAREVRAMTTRKPTAKAAMIATKLHFVNGVRMHVRAVQAVQNIEFIGLNF